MPPALAAFRGPIHKPIAPLLLSCGLYYALKGGAVIVYRQGRNYENLNRGIFDGTGIYDIPRLFPEYCTAPTFIGFNYAKSCKVPFDKGLHFFIDDYQFIRVWSNPDTYLEMLRDFKCVCTPDFSTYTDFPKAVQIYNHYRKHWLGAYWQHSGITVIPTISWSDKASFDWCFDGEPEGGTVAVSSVGTQLNKDSRKLFIDGYNEMLVRLQPSLIYFYGLVPDECRGNIVRLAAYQEKFRSKTEVL